MESDRFPLINILIWVRHTFQIRIIVDIFIRYVYNNYMNICS